MWEWFFEGMSAGQLIVLMVCAILIGINKTGMPGIGILPVVILSMIFPAHFSTGIQLVMLCAADVMAVVYYRNRAQWGIVLKLLPCALAGLLLGSITLRYLDDQSLKCAIGIIILLMVALQLFRDYCLKAESIPTHWIFSVLVGLTAGFTTQVANAAGPVMAIYLLAMRFPKEKYMGTCVWYFLIVNWIKLPLFVLEGRVTMAAVKADLAMLPLLAIGAVLGILFIRKVSQKWFNWIVQVLVVVAAIKLLYDSLIA